MAYYCLLSTVYGMRCAMDLLAQAGEGFRGIEAADTLKGQALAFLRQWLTEPEFVAYRPQLAWLIEGRQWAGLLDRFYQILPFGTGGTSSVACSCCRTA